MSEQKTPVKPSAADDEIDLLELVKTLWNGRRTVLIAVISGAMLGVLVALLSPKEYTATSIMVPQMGSDSQSKLGGLGGLAALAGISLDASPTSELSPLIYPQIVGSIPFQLELMNTQLNFQEHTNTIRLFDYYTKYGKTSVLGTLKKYTLGLPGVIISAIKGKPKEFIFAGVSTHQPIRLTEDQVSVQKILDGVVSLEVNSKEGFLTLTTRMPEAMAAAQLAQKAQDLLQRYITEFKIEKAKTNLDFIQGRYDETKAELQKDQVNLATASDRNKNFISGLPKIETDRLQARFTITFSVFQELAKQLEQAKIQVKKETPVFTIIEPVTVPSEKSKPKKPMIVFIWLFLGGIVGVGWVFGKVFMKDIKLKWNETK